jgi:hypothetical protein
MTMSDTKLDRIERDAKVEVGRHRESSEKTKEVMATFRQRSKRLDRLIEDYRLGEDSIRRRDAE